MMLLHNGLFNTACFNAACFNAIIKKVALMIVLCANIAGNCLKIIKYLRKAISI